MFIIELPPFLQKSSFKVIHVITTSFEIIFAYYGEA